MYIFVGCHCKISFGTNPLQIYAKNRYKTREISASSGISKLFEAEKRILENQITTTNKIAENNSKKVGGIGVPVAIGSALGNIGANIAMRAFDGLKNSSFSKILSLMY